MTMLKNDVILFSLKGFCVIGLESALKLGLSYVYRFAKLDAKFFNFFARLFIFILFSVRKVSYVGDGKIK